MRYPKEPFQSIIELLIVVAVLFVVLVGVEYPDTVPTSEMQFKSLSSEVQFGAIDEILSQHLARVVASAYELTAGMSHLAIR